MKRIVYLVIVPALLLLVIENLQAQNPNAAGAQNGTLPQPQLSGGPIGPGQNISPQQLQALMFMRALQSRGGGGPRTGFNPAMQQAMMQQQMMQQQQMQQQQQAQAKAAGGGDKRKMSPAEKKALRDQQKQEKREKALAAKAAKSKGKAKGSAGP